MATEIIGGLIIGFFAKNWLGRIVLPCILGIFACGELFFALHKKALSPHRRSEMRKGGMSEHEIEEIEQTSKQISKMIFQTPWVTGWRLYAVQFFGCYITSLFFSLIAGAVKVFLIDK